MLTPETVVHHPLARRADLEDFEEELMPHGAWQAACSECDWLGPNLYEERALARHEADRLHCIPQNGEQPC